MVLSGSTIATLFLEHVLCVVLIGTEKQVVGIETWRIITAVQNAHVVWNGTDTEFIGNAMHALRFIVDRYSAITRLGPAASPFYAAILSNCGSVREGMMDFSHLNVSFIQVVRALIGGEMPIRARIISQIVVLLGQWKLSVRLT